MSGFSAQDRPEIIDALAARPFDLLVIGGGITGAGIARDAALRGLRAALVERRDFAHGASSHSARVAHGGVRYIETGNFATVRHASAERHTLDRIAPNLVPRLGFTLAGDNWMRLNRYALGLALYDLLGGWRNEPSRRLTAARLRRDEPALARPGVIGGARYVERGVDDARLTLETALSARRAGAVILNYAEARTLLKSGASISGAGVLDGLTGRTFEVRAACVVNATGAWSNAARALDASDPPPLVMPSKGSHLVFPRTLLPVRGAVDFRATGGRRWMYVVPWHNTVLVGTTDSAFEGDPDTVAAAGDEADWMIASVNAAFVDVHLTRADAISSFAGLRPLAFVDGQAMYKMSREHVIAETPSGLISIVGGKLTTHRQMAEDVVDRVCARLGVRARCRTREVTLDDGWEPGGADAMSLRSAAECARGLAPDVVENLTRSYGRRWLEVVALIDQEPALAERLTPSAPYLHAQIVWAARHEMACDLDDALARRTRLRHEDAAHGADCAGRVAAEMAPAAGWSEDETARQAQHYVDRMTARGNGLAPSP
ncbi:MAG TPA: glycerol-3-phosphate dehydrogenase/oxidase [Thermoflexales bacterium]|nr:glycerol-3-phosphate dehydrogenase/oxidase [Thermoflexales bacterium]